METINHEYYVSLEVAKLLKEAGFDWECMCYYSVNTLHEPNNGFIHIYKQYNALFYDHNRTKMPVYSAPTLAVAQRWLREVKGYELWVYPFSTHYRFSFYGYLANEDNNTNFDTYEQAKEAGIKKVLELILEKGE